MAAITVNKVTFGSATISCAASGLAPRQKKIPNASRREKLRTFKGSIAFRIAENRNRLPLLQSRRFAGPRQRLQGVGYTKGKSATPPLPGLPQSCSPALANI